MRSLDAARPSTARLVACVLVGVLLATASPARADDPASAPHPPADARRGPAYVATIPPLAMILRELVDGRATVDTLLAPGASPHTFDPRPSDARRTESAHALFYVDDALDGWAARLPAARRIAVFPLLPEEERHTYGGCTLDHDADEGAHAHDHAHDEGEPDPHFWTDPVAVRALLPPLVAQLAQLDPAGADRYAANAASFDARLAALHEDLASQLGFLRGRAIVLFHPSFEYFARRYGVRVVAVVEPTPGQEPSARQLISLIETVKAEGAIAVFLEPQFPPQSGRAVAEGAGVPLSLLDPIGGVPGRSTYADLVIFNVERLAEAVP